MFGRKGKVTITDTGVTVMGDVTVDDQRSKGVNWQFEEFLTGFKEVNEEYPTAEEARNIEPEIREDLVEEAVKKTLDRVICVAKQGRFAAAVNYAPFSGKLCTNAERKTVISKLESLGYTYMGGTITW